MKQAIIGTLIGFLVGAALGGFLYALVYKDADEPAGKTIYYPFTGEKKDESQKRWIPVYAWLGVLLGGGLGSVTGSVVGGVGAIVRVIKETERSRSASLQ